MTVSNSPPDSDSNLLVDSDSSSFRPGLDRRTWLAGAASLFAVAGCTPKPNANPADETAATSIASEVPLRIVWVGSEGEVETLRRTWQSISEQPLDVRVADSLQSDPASGGDTVSLVEMAAKADVIVYPLTMMAEMVNENRLMPLLGDLATSDEPDMFMSSDRRSVPAALKVATSFAGERRAVPLGGHLPALLLGETLASKSGADSFATWSDYEKSAKRNEGKFAEPTAVGWAGTMFLWRLASSLDATWLFDRETLKPLVDQPEYIDVLEQMSRTIKLSSSTKGQTPGQIYQSILSGELLAGIGFPSKRSEVDDAGDQVTLAKLPSSRIGNGDEFSIMATGGDLDRVMVNPFMLVGSLASSCRQTTAADRFLDWLAGGEGSESLYRNIDSIIDVQSVGSSVTSSAGDGYQTWLRKQLSNPNVVPPLQLIGAPEYYRVLDVAVRDCVHGDASPKATCETIAKDWMSLHRQFDLSTQQRAWRRAQGIAF